MEVYLKNYSGLQSWYATVVDSDGETFSAANPHPTQTLRNLSISTFRYVKNCLIERIATQYPSITKLKLNSAPYGLEYEIVGRRFITDEVLQTIVVKLPGLKSLSLKDCRKVSDAGFTGISPRRVHDIQRRFYIQESSQWLEDNMGNVAGKPLNLLGK
jgi:hypothetical protein